jgi:ADP-ribosylglycohydrolase
MAAIPADYLERLYAGFIGKNVGIRLGAPVEPAIWTYGRIREIYGEVTSYLKPFRNFAADDDANGPCYFIRPLFEGDPRKPLEAEAVGRAWLDYSREGRGMFWWGGYGISTEHTAFLNLKAGIPAPESGSIARNGAAVAEQIGGQIFIDTWGLVWPGRPREAADYAATAASVSHDGDGKNGARFIAACIAAAFSEAATAGLGATAKESALRRVVEAGLDQLDSNCLYSDVAKAVMGFHGAHPGDWRPCQEYLIAEWGYDRYPGLCHMIPNAGVCVLALMYGAGDFARTVEIATMCGWDTDCNAGNVGTILGVLGGLDSIPPRYRDPINDGIVLSGLPGSLNILDIPTFSRKLAAVGYRLAGEATPVGIEAAIARGDGERAFHFDFALPGSTHGMRVSDPVAFSAVHRARSARNGGGALEFRYERIPREGKGKLFWKPFYRRCDFDDERYSPVFSPVARPGQKVEIRFRRESWEGEKVGIAGYVRDSSTGKDIETTTTIFPEPGEDAVMGFTIPDVGGSQVDEVGLVLTGYSGAARRDSGRLLVESFSISGKARYSIDMARQSVEFGCITPFSHDGGRWTLEEGRMQLMTDVPATSYTGGYGVEDQVFSVTVTPRAGESLVIGLRCGGAMRGYFAGFDGQGRVSLFRRDFGMERLASTGFDWKLNTKYVFTFEASGELLTFAVDGQALLSARDGRHRSGMVACGALAPARALFGPFEVQEL